jgi:hypothetical protein
MRRRRRRRWTRRRRRRQWTQRRRIARRQPPVQQQQRQRALQRIPQRVRQRLRQQRPARRLPLQPPLPPVAEMPPGQVCPVPRQFRAPRSRRRRTAPAVRRNQRTRRKDPRQRQTRERHLRRRWGCRRLQGRVHRTRPTLLSRRSPPQCPRPSLRRSQTSAPVTFPNRLPLRQRRRRATAARRTGSCRRTPQTPE